MALHPRNQPTIPNAVAPQEVRVVEHWVAGEAITAGNCVRLATGAEDASYTPGRTCMQGDADTFGLGVALTAAAAAGDVIEVQTYGRNLIAITTGGGAAAGAALILGASGATAEQATIGSIEAEDVIGLIGYARAADTGTSLAIGDGFIVTLLGRR